MRLCLAIMAVLATVSTAHADCVALAVSEQPTYHPRNRRAIFYDASGAHCEAAKRSAMLQCQVLHSDCRIVQWAHGGWCVAGAHVSNYRARGNTGWGAGSGSNMLEAKAKAAMACRNANPGHSCTFWPDQPVCSRSDQ
jgi:hypothetical protein